MGRGEGFGEWTGGDWGEFLKESFWSRKELEKEITDTGEDTGDFLQGLVTSSRW